NNPALQMLLMAGLPAYKLGWTLSPDDLLMISVGTGLHRCPIDPGSKAVKGRLVRRVLGAALCEDIDEAAFAAQAMRSMIADSALFALQIMQSLSNPRFSWRINGEIKSLDGELLLNAVKGLAPHVDPRGILRFQRYDLPLEKGGLVPGEFDIDATQ